MGQYFLCFFSAFLPKRFTPNLFFICISLLVPLVSPNSDSSNYQPTSPLFLSPTLRRSTRSQLGTITHPLGTEEATSVAPPSGFASLWSWVKSIKSGLELHASTLAAPPAPFRLQAPNVPTAATLLRQFLVSFLGGPSVQYSDLDDTFFCYVSGSGIPSLLSNDQSWTMWVCYPLFNIMINWQPTFSAVPVLMPGL
jgi:hypothetical protein